MWHVNFLRSKMILELSEICRLKEELEDIKMTIMGPLKSQILKLVCGEEVI